MDDYILRYGVICGKRESKRQKIKFLQMAEKQFENSGYPVDITTSSLRFMNASKDFYNLYAGDVKKAKTIFITYYDTAVKSLLPQKQYAFESGYHKSMMYLNLGLIVGIIGIVWFIYMQILPKIQIEGFVSLWGLLVLIIFFFALFCVTHIRGGIANRFNMVRNTSSIITLFALADEIKNGEVAFAFVDGGTNSEYGLSMLNQYVAPTATKVYLDAIGNGDTIQCFTNKKLNLNDIKIHPLSKELAKYGDILFTSGDVEKGQVWIMYANTSKDKDIEVSRVQNMLEKLKKLCIK